MRSNSLLSAGVVAVCSGAAVGNIVVYDPGLGTMPEAQGWTFIGNTMAGAAVSGGVLTYGPTTNSGTTAWEALMNGADFSWQTWSLTASVRLEGASFGNVSGFRRGGFTLGMGDGAGRWIIAEMGSSSISLRNDNNGTTDPAMSFPLNDAFHSISLEAGPGGARLIVDGLERLTLGFGSGGSQGGFWGDSSILASAQATHVGSVILVPAPAGVLAVTLGVLAAGRRRRG